MKTVYLVHGWDGSPDKEWFPWLKNKLEENNFEVIPVYLPNPEEPRINTWVPHLQSVVKNPNEETYFIGHSMGCQTIARYLETLPDNIKVGGAVFVAGFFKELSNVEESATEIANEWLTTSFDLKKSAKHLNKSVAIFSDNDPYVPVSNEEEFKNIFGSEIIEVKNRGHFNEDAGITEIPELLDVVLKITK